MRQNGNVLLIYIKYTKISPLNTGVIKNRLQNLSFRFLL